MLKLDCWPVPPTTPISQLFGQNPAMYAPYGLAAHNGIDFAVVTGTKVYACSPGIIERVRSDAGGYGLHVKVTHTWGASIYGHFSKALVKVGDVVEAGQVIGYSGNTGNSTGPHLHFECRPAGVSASNGYAGAVDPMPALRLAGFSPLNIPAPEPKDTLFKAKVLADILNVRNGPSISSLPVGQLKKGEVVDVVGIAGVTVWFELSNGFYSAFRYTNYQYMEVILISQTILRWIRTLI